jgi:hypothetical protein
MLGNVVVTSRAPTPIVLFGFHCLALAFKIVYQWEFRLSSVAYSSSCRILTLLKQQTVHRVRQGILGYFASQVTRPVVNPATGLTLTAYSVFWGSFEFHIAAI